MASPVVRERYDAYVPPRWVRGTVQRLLESLPDEYLVGMSAVVLIESNGTNRPKSGRRQRHNRKHVTLGRYHRQMSGEPAWIELVVDEIVAALPEILRLVPPFRDLVVGRVLFHEVGHHLAARRLAIGREPEASANAWQRRLLRMHFRKRYSYLRPFVPLLALLGRAVRWIAARRALVLA